MAPKRDSSNGSTDQLSNFPAPPQLLPTKTGSVAGTPRISPAKRRAALTVGQRQYMIDNLQAEITNRARDMRAESKNRVDALRNRLEARIYRVPAAIRKANLAELLVKYAEANAPSPARTQPAKAIAPPKSRAAKRNSTHVLEDEPADQTAATKRPRLEGARTAPRLIDARILSPKSHNSRTLPASPFKAMGSPLKSGIARAPSPTKQMPAAAMATTASSMAKTAASSLARTATATSNATKTTTASIKSKAKPGARTTTKASTASTASMRSKGAAPTRTRTQVAADEEENRRHSNESSATTNSTGTAIVTKKRTGTAAKKTAEKVVGIPATGKRVKAAPAPAPKTTAGTVRGGRTLRTRP